MAERFVYLNGDYVPERDAKVSVLDRGFRWGDAVDPCLDRAAVTALCEEVQAGR
jgi:hypothetical protein